MPKNDCDRSAYFNYSNNICYCQAEYNTFCYNYLMEFKDRLKELRKENDFSQTDIAKRLCLSKMAISHWECGDSEPSIAQLKTLAALFDVSVDYLIGYVD